MSATATRSSTWCIVCPTRPSSTTGHQRRTQRASEVPPLVPSSGVRPVTSCTAPVSMSESGPGSVRKASPLVAVSSV